MSKDSKTMIIGLVISVVMAVIIVVGGGIEKGKREGEIEDAYKNNDVELFFKKLEAKPRSVISTYSDRFDMAKFCDQQLTTETLLRCLKKSQEYQMYSANVEAILSYSTKFGDSILLALLEEELVNDVEMYIVLSQLTIDSKSLSELKAHYEKKRDELKDNIQKSKYLTINSFVKGRLIMKDATGLVDLTGAILDYNGTNVVLAYREVNKIDVASALSMVDTYDEKEQVYYKLMSRVSETPQNSNYFSGTVRKAGYTVSSYQNTYDVYKLCYEGEELACIQYCDDEGDCSEKESYKSQQARNELKELSELFDKLGVAP